MRVFTIYATNFLLAAALGVVFVFFEDVQTIYGLSDLQVGLIAGSGFGASFVVQLALAPFADRGQTAKLAVLALVTGVIGLIGFGFGNTVLILAISRALGGVGLGLFTLLARKALLGVDAAGGGAKLGILLSSGVGGFIVGPLIGATLEPLGFETPFIVMSVVLVLVGVPATRAIMNSKVATSPSVDYSDMGKLLRRPKVQAALMVQVIIFGFIGIFNSSIDRFLTDLGASTGMVAFVVLVVGAPLVVLPRFAGRLAERLGGATVMIPALLIFIPAMFGYGLAPTVWVAMLAGLLHGSGESFASIAAQVLVLEVTGAERAAVGSALLDAAGLIAATITAFLAPLIYGSVGKTMFLFAGVGGLVLGVMARVRVRSAWD